MVQETKKREMKEGIFHILCFTWLDFTGWLFFFQHQKAGYLNDIAFQMDTEYKRSGEGDKKFTKCSWY